MWSVTFVLFIETYSNYWAFKVEWGRFLSYNLWHYNNMLSALLIWQQNLSMSVVDCWSNTTKTDSPCSPLTRYLAPNQDLCTATSSIIIRSANPHASFNSDHCNNEWNTLKWAQPPVFSLYSACARSPTTQTLRTSPWGRSLSLRQETLSELPAWPPTYCMLQCRRDTGYICTNQYNLLTRGLCFLISGQFIQFNDDISLE